MSVVPVWLTGARGGLTTLSLTGMTVASDGTLTAATGSGVQSFVGKWESVELDSDPEIEEISASDSTRQNKVILKESTRIRFTNLMEKALRAGAATNEVANPIASLVTTYDYFTATCARAGKTWTFIGVRGQFNETYGKGAGKSSLSLEMADPGAANPGYA